MIIIVLFGFGLIFGSFVNALVWRLHEQGKGRVKSQESRVKKAQKSPGVSYSILRGRSMCPDCHHTLSARDLVPVLSWLWLRGKCRYCHKPISAQYPLVELACGLLFALIYIAIAHATPYFVLHTTYYLLYVVFFLALALYDLKWFILPDKLVYSLTGLALSQVVLFAWLQHSYALLWQPVAGAAIVFGLFWGIYQVSKGAWIGGGDVKLAIALGLIAGTPLRALLVVFFASLLGTLASAPLLFKGKKGLMQHIPFGPYLLAGCFIVMLYANQIVSWYQNLLSIKY